MLTPSDGSWGRQQDPLLAAALPLRLWRSVDAALPFPSDGSYAYSRLQQSQYAQFDDPCSFINGRRCHSKRNFSYLTVACGSAW